MLEGFINMEKRNNILNILFSVLLFGGLWGILEATLGTFLHLPFVSAGGVFTSSTAIMVPLAFMLMGMCYKKTGNFRTSIYMGIMAASIKAIVCAIFHLSFNPVFYILMEALTGAIALLVIRPKEIISFRGLGTFILANTMYLLGSTFIRVNVMSVTPTMLIENIEKYAFMYNMVATLYVFITGAIIYGIKVLAQKYEWKFDGFKKVLYSPITASVVACLMIAVTFVVR